MDGYGIMQGWDMSDVGGRVVDEVELGGVGRSACPTVSLKLSQLRDPNSIFSGWTICETSQTSMSLTAVASGRRKSPSW
jgi:hypothetical protein